LNGTTTDVRTESVPVSTNINRSLKIVGITIGVLVGLGLWALVALAAVTLGWLG
jgi:hypothetical protein